MIGPIMTTTGMQTTTMQPTTNCKKRRSYHSNGSVSSMLGVDW